MGNSVLKALPVLCWGFKMLFVCFCWVFRLMVFWLDFFWLVVLWVFLEEGENLPSRFGSQSRLHISFNVSLNGKFNSWSRD